MDPGSERIARLLDAVLAVSSDLDLSQVLSRIVQSACDLVDARYGALGVLAPEGEHLVEFVTQGLSDANGGLLATCRTGEEFSDC